MELVVATSFHWVKSLTDGARELEMHAEAWSANEPSFNKCWDGGLVWLCLFCFLGGPP